LSYASMAMEVPCKGGFANGLSGQEFPHAP